MVNRLVWAAVLAGCMGLRVAAQELPSRPLAFANGRVTLGGDVSAAIGPDDTGFFNYADYDHSTLRTLRLSLAASIKAGDHVALLAEVRSENVETPEPYGVYLRVRPWAARLVDIQVGRVPPTFGAFSRRAYPSENPLISYPLAYQYLTSLRPDALPAGVDELLRMRGRGWLTSFSIGDPTPDHGVPLMSAFRWDTGVQVHAATAVADGTISVTTGTLSNPRFDDDNGAPQVAGRVALHPIAGLLVGMSGAEGPFVARSALHAVLPDGRPGDFRQTALGGDVEYSWDYYLVRAETILSRWTLPVVSAAGGALPLSAVSTSVEGRYKIRPGLYAAARFDHLGFSEVSGSTVRQPWDAPVTRWDIGGGYSIQRNLLIKAEYQYNMRAGGRVETLGLGAVQVVYWF